MDISAIRNYSGWMNYDLFDKHEILCERHLQEAFQLDFAGKSTLYTNGYIVLNNVQAYGVDLIGNWSRAFEYPYVSLNIPRDQGLSILDVGSGYGYFPFYLSSLGHEVTCSDIIDLSYLYADTGVSFVKDNIIESSIVNRYDIIYCVSVLEHLDNMEAAVNNMYKLLKPGGKLILTLDCDMCGNMHNDIPGYGEVAKLVTMLNAQFTKSIFDFNLSRENIVTSIDFKNSKWKLPWKEAMVPNNPKFLEKIKHIYVDLYNKETIPCLAVFVGVWDNI